MNFRRTITIAAFAVALALVGSLAHADALDQAMKLTFGQPIAIPGQVLPAGTYWFVRPDPTTNPNTLQVFDGDRKNVVATLQTGTVQIVKPSGRIMLSFADRSPNPQALLSVVYPGTDNGHLFAIQYSDQEQRQFSEFPKVTVRVDEKGNMEKVESNAGM